LATEGQINKAAVCRQLGYSKQALYKSLQTKKLRCINRQVVKQKVLAIRAFMPRLGTRKLYYLLKDSFEQEKLGVGRDKLFEILRAEGLLVAKKKRFVKTTQSYHWLRKYSNLVKNIEVLRPEQLWVADITYLSTRQGNAFLHLLTDAYSKRIMGYCLSDNLTASSTLKALRMALKQRQFKGELIHHSDRGLQYCSTMYVKTLQQYGIQISMTEDGSPYDNAIAERINGILKDEFGLDEVFKNNAQLEHQVIQSISTYNFLRPHQSNNLLTPNQMHQQHILRPKAWRKKSTRTLEGSCGFLPSHNIPKPVNQF
jgi:putative transposase